MFGFFRKKAVEHLMLNPNSFALASVAIVVVWHTLFALALMIKSEFMMKIWANTHFVRSVQDVADLEAHFQVTPMNFILGLIHHVVCMYIFGYAFAWLYNRFQK